MRNRTPSVLVWARTMSLAVALAACGDNRAVSPTVTPHDGGSSTLDAPEGPAATPQPTVLFSEIMYHPVKEQGPTDEHEFIEIFNASASPVDLTGWTLSGQVDYAFPDGSTIDPGAYRVIARNRARLAEIADYGLRAEDLFGDYTGTLSNSGGTLSLNAPNRAKAVDKVRYDDGFPWPIAADALGADAPWLGMTDEELLTHRFRGRSLERISFELPADDVANWVASPLDGVTPAQSNTLSGVPPTIVDALEVVPSGGGALITPTDTVTVRVHLNAHQPVEAARLEWFVDEAQRTDEPITSVDMTQVGTDLSGGTYTAAFGPRPANSILRFRILANAGGEPPAVISPRASDPYPWHSAFVSPAVYAKPDVYGLFIDATRWTRLWDNINFSNGNDRRVIPETVNGTTVRCTIRPSWDAREPAVFVVGGQVYDVFVRYQGSRFNRPNGSNIDTARTTMSPLPDRPRPLRALAWNIEFPKYKLFGERDSILLNKLLPNQSCPGLDAFVGERVYSAAGVPVAHPQYAQLYVNGGYYNYAMNLEQPTEAMMRRFLAPEEPMGDLFKADGSPLDEGPWGWSDARPLQLTNCPYTLEQRYAYSYDRKSNNWDGPAVLIDMIDALDAARRSAAETGDTLPLREFLTDRFDVDAMLSYLAVRNWSEPWDEQYHNFYLYRRASGKWLMIPWDLDKEFGEQFNWVTNKSFFIGEENDVDNNQLRWNRIKDAFFKAFRPEYVQRILDLSQPGQPLHPDFFKAAIDDSAKYYDAAAAAAAPINQSCSFETERKNLSAFADGRYAHVQATFATPTSP